LFVGLLLIMLWGFIQIFFPMVNPLSIFCFFFCLFSFFFHFFFFFNFSSFLLFRFFSDSILILPFSFPQRKKGGVVHAIYCLLGALLFCGFVLFDTSRLIYVYGPDQFIEATIELFLDFINIFLFILSCFGGGGRH